MSRAMSRTMGSVSETLSMWVTVFRSREVNSSTSAVTVDPCWRRLASIACLRDGSRILARAMAWQ